MSASSLAFQVAVGYAAVLWYAVCGIVAHRALREPREHREFCSGYCCPECDNKQGSAIGACVWPITLVGWIAIMVVGWCVRRLIIRPARSTARLLAGGDQ